MSKNSKNSIAKPKNSNNSIVPKNSSNSIVPKNSKNDVARIGHAPLVSTGQRAMTQLRARETQSVSRAIYKDKYSGCSSVCSVNKKSTEFMDRKTGSIGYKEETTHAKTFKVNDKVSGSSFEYQTQVKFKEVHISGPARAPALALAPAKSNNHKSSGSKSSSKSHGHF